MYDVGILQRERPAAQRFSAMHKCIIWVKLNITIIILYSIHNKSFGDHSSRNTIRNHDCIVLYNPISIIPPIL